MHCCDLVVELIVAFLAVAVEAGWGKMNMEYGAVH